MAVTSTLVALLAMAAKQRASSVHFTVNALPMLRIDDALVEVKQVAIITADFVTSLTEELLTPEQRSVLEKEKSITLVKELGNKQRYKIYFFYQKKFISAVFRPVPSQVPALETLGLPRVVTELVNQASGLVIVAGPYGSGRTTTVAALLDAISKTRLASIVTVEQPIEYMLQGSKGLLEQREVGRDALSFADGVGDCKNADVDVLAVGNFEEAGVLPEILDFANGGKLAIVELQAVTVMQVVEAVIASYSATDAPRARQELASALRAIVVQRLVPRTGGGLVLAFEILVNTEAVQSSLKENRLAQLVSIMQTSREEGMITLDQSLAALVRSGEVLLERAAELAADPSRLMALARK